MFRKYMHIEKFGNEEVEGIELGQVVVFPKLDGTNASTWRNEQGQLCAGSRNRVLSLENDNAGFYAWVKENPSLNHFHEHYPYLRLYGEWLVPHSFKGYREEAWRRFWIFDVYNDITEQYLAYNVYAPLLHEAGLDIVLPLAHVKNGDYTRFLHYLSQNKFLCPDNGEPGEGIVIKNYDYYNKFGRQCWAKIIRQEFKELHTRSMGAPEVNSSLMNEERILDKVLTSHLIDKTYEKIKNERGGWRSEYIPELFGRLYYDIIKEELYDALKDINFGTINFKTLKALMIQRVKQDRRDLF